MARSPRSPRWCGWGRPSRCTTSPSEAPTPTSCGLAPTIYGSTTATLAGLNGRPTEIDYPLAAGAGADKVLFTSYDVVGDLLSRVDGDGQETDYAYADADGRLSAVTYPGASANDVSLAYDAYDRTTSVTDGAGVETTGYDDLDETLSTTTTYAGLPAQAFSYAYEPDGARASMTNAAGTWTYGYDADGRYASMTSPAGTSSATYYDNGWQATRTLPNGLKTTYGYFGTGDLGSLWNSNGSGSTTYSSYGPFTYDGVFNMTGMTSAVPVSGTQGGSTTYAYDSKDRLTGESSTRLGGYSQANAYDAAGNPTTLRGVAQGFDADSHLAGGAFAYDGNGSPTTYRNAGMAYDPEARATQIGSLTAGYRSDGLRAWKASGGATTYFYYDEDGDPVLETDGGGNVTAENVVAPDGLVARKQGGSWTQYAFDPEGSVALRLDSAGDVLSSSVYDAYGTESSTAPASDPFGYHARDGYYADRETGLLYCQNRYYDPQAGRWVTRDPIGANGGINVYGYCQGGPVGNADPSGLLAFNFRVPTEDDSDGSGLDLSVGPPSLGLGGLLTATALAGCSALAEAGGAGVPWWDSPQARFRRGLIRHSEGHDPGRRVQAHHIGPQKRDTRNRIAKEYGQMAADSLDDGEQYGSWWPSPDHQRKEVEYDRLINQWIDDHPGYTFAQFAEYAWWLTRHMRG